MKTINVTFEDDEIEFIKKVKGNISYRKFILGLARQCWKRLEK